MRRVDKILVLRERLRLATQRYDDLLDQLEPIDHHKPRPPRPDGGNLINAGVLKQLRHSCESMERHGDNLADRLGTRIIGDVDE